MRLKDLDRLLVDSKHGKLVAPLHIFQVLLFLRILRSAAIFMRFELVFFSLGSLRI